MPYWPTNLLSERGVPQRLRMNHLLIETFLSVTWSIKWLCQWCSLTWSWSPSVFPVWHRLAITSQVGKPLTRTRARPFPGCERMNCIDMLACVTASAPAYPVVTFGVATKGYRSYPRSLAKMQLIFKPAPICKFRRTTRQSRVHVFYISTAFSRTTTYAMCHTTTSWTIQALSGCETN